ncbi:MAG: threonine synthase [Bacteroidota bacterium]|nr:threonine synthase [Bacteroidota bacterium]
MKTDMPGGSFIDQLLCSRCNRSYSPFVVNTYATCCQQPLLAHYKYSIPFSKDHIHVAENSMWRYFEMLPVLDKRNIISLGEGMSPVMELNNLANQYNFEKLLLKDEAYNPTGSFKARGISLAVSKAKELAIDRLIMPTAGNAGGALAAYCAKAGMKCIVVMPESTPELFKKECRLYGAELFVVKGLINDCAKKVEEIKKQNDYFDVSTLKEPYRLEGKKTMGYEIAEQLKWQLPDVIVYPAGGGTGLIGIWKAFQELLQFGWIKAPLPKMIAVQAENCAPLAAAFRDPVSWKEHFSFLPSVANGLAVPFPFGMDLIQKVVYESAGAVITVTEDEIMRGIKEVAKTEGILLSPEGSATWKALDHLLNRKVIATTDKILLLNTGSGYKYLENFRHH